MPTDQERYAELQSLMSASHPMQAAAHWERYGEELLALQRKLDNNNARRKIWEVVESRMIWDRENRKWTRTPDRIIATGLTQAEADGVMERHPDHGSVHSRPVSQGSTTVNP